METHFLKGYTSVLIMFWSDFNILQKWTLEWVLSDIIKMADSKKFIGKYNCISIKHYNEYLQELGCNFVLRKAVTVCNPELEVIYDPKSEIWIFRTSTLLQSFQSKFMLGEEFEEQTPDGRKVRAIITKEGASFISIQISKKVGEKSTKVVHKFQGNECLVTSHVIDSSTDLSCRQVFRKKWNEINKYIYISKNTWKFAKKTFVSSSSFAFIKVKKNTNWPWKLLYSLIAGIVEVLAEETEKK